MARIGTVIIATALLQLSGCGGSLSCTPSIEAGLYISVLDATTGEPALCETTIDVFEDGEVVESFVAAEGACSGQRGSVRMLDERPGVYQVVVSRPGFETYASEPFEVRSRPNDCHVETVYLEVALTPEM